MRGRAAPRASRPARNGQGHSQRAARRGMRDAVSQQGSFSERLALRVTRWLIILIFAAAIGGVALTVVRAPGAPWPAASGQTDKRIGIISGHRGHDSGAVCDDGLTEAEVNFRHATRVADLLRAHGYQVDVLDEYDVRLTGYRARAVVSIHADSCARINTLATGFKVAHPATSEASRQLADCLKSHYAQRTGLSFHAMSITRDMTNYHAFSRVAPQTPIAIIETGFLFLDRPLLVRHPEIVAQGIAEGVLCFLRDESLAD